MNGINLFLMVERCGSDEARRRFRMGEPPRFLRPGFDSTPTGAAYLTDSEVWTLRRRIESYLETCARRRERELRS